MIVHVGAGVTCTCLPATNSGVTDSVTLVL